MTINLLELEQKAKQATPGKWTAGKYGQFVISEQGDESTFNDEENLGYFKGYLIGESFHTKNADFVAAMNPQTALLLLSITRSAQSILSHIDHGEGDWTKIVGELREKLKGVV